MNRLVMVVAGLLACIGCATAGGTSDEASRILQLDADWSQAAQGRDVDRVVSFWADDATVFPPGSPPVIGKPAIREFVAKSFQTPGFSISSVNPRKSMRTGGARTTVHVFWFASMVMRP